jgi:hypothetical protein
LPEEAGQKKGYRILQYFIKLHRPTELKVLHYNV